MTAALWAYARPPQAVLEAYAADERIGRTQVDFHDARADYLTTVAIGLGARAARPTSS